MDLGVMPDKKADKVQKRSNNNSICSGIPTTKRGTPRPALEKKAPKDMTEKK